MLLKKLYLVILLGFLVPAVSLAQPADGRTDAALLVKESIDYYRGTASMSKVAMTIHRPDWERTMTIEAWTRGTKDSLFFIAAPAKDKGNGTLKKGREMWTYNPKVNRVIKLPPSMMSQAWMGSDFSNNDLAKSDSVIEDYDHAIESVKESDGHKVYVIRSVPKPAAPVVWGMQRLYLRDDKILLREEFFDEDRQLVKAMTGSDIRMLGGKLFPRIWRMQKADVKDEYTQLEYQELKFLKDLPDRLFTITSLKTRGR
jgi:outer membrane lipoprotein-sorting protein